MFGGFAISTSSSKQAAHPRPGARTSADAEAVPATAAVPSAAPPARSRAARVGLLAGLGTTLAVVTVLSVGVGAVGVSPGTTLGVIAHHLGLGDRGEWTAAEDIIVWQYRLPRVLLAAVVGAGLALVGVVLQAVVRNPLADPWVLGVSSGAGLGAVGLVLLGGTAVAASAISLGAFVGAGVATTLLFLLARRRGRMTPVRLVLAGVALSYLFSAGTNYLVLTSDADEVFGILYFLLGSLAQARFDDLILPLIVVLIGLIHVLARARGLNALMTGDETATALGVSPDRIRAELLLTASLITGVLVAASGGIGFVGLVVPHIARMLVGAEHRRLVPVTLLGGAIFLVAADAASRVLAAPLELPIGVVTAVTGAPFFLWLMRRDGAARRGGLAR